MIWALLGRPFDRAKVVAVALVRIFSLLDFFASGRRDMTDGLIGEIVTCCDRDEWRLRYLV